MVKRRKKTVSTIKLKYNAFSLVHTMNEEFGLIITTSEEKNLGVTFWYKYFCDPIWIATSLFSVAVAP